jgi:predicted secreted protein
MKKWKKYYGLSIMIEQIVVNPETQETEYWPLERQALVKHIPNLKAARKLVRSIFNLFADIIRDMKKNK